MGPPIQWYQKSKTKKVIHKMMFYNIWSVETGRLFARKKITIVRLSSKWAVKQIEGFLMSLSDHMSRAWEQ